MEFLKQDMSARCDAGDEGSFTFADVFSGCGGLSLGLVNAGWKGCFAIEKNSDAFSTFVGNFVQGGVPGHRFDWPAWLPCAAISATEFLSMHGDCLRAMKGQLTLLAGGPPCQGFSLAGRRTQSDPRNVLTDDYIELVKLLEPRFLLIENVKGFTLPFRKGVDDHHENIPYSLKVTERLKQARYKVYSSVIDLSKFGVPQSRNRFILIAIKEGDAALEMLGNDSPIDFLHSFRKQFLKYKRLPMKKLISARDAIGDLETHGRKLVPCTDSPNKSYVQVDYLEGEFRSPFIKLMRKGVKSAPNSLRLARHAEATVEQFKSIMDTCMQGRTLSKSDRERLGINKHALTPLEASMPSATITTLPDDILHYSEPRILTARENARLQTFPDTFQFHGKYTTGGASRKADCPRYTQIGNAVPPLFAEAVGLVLKRLASRR
jgi:DNA (cytosine-5)-methyltransferase 1